MSAVECHEKILYRSLPAHSDLHPSDTDILCSALRFNAANGITGYLLRTGNQFIQALHGPCGAIAALIERIAVDPRHSGFDLLIREETGPISPFSGWSLGYDHFMADFAGVGLLPGGTRPPLTPEMRAALFDRVVEAATEALEFGSGLPQARRPGESDADYLTRLESPV
ncbi:BLUF domain-containing protein [Szabonella alba]|uniref:BLUF domain-containing protein n=1 Tax=Szabonella alba TaxID=2804194 RepID=A0A8K0VG94_9RHOB|nr:BLUF domain-containing protein [Szabonella alba]MBL4918822.1 BLUF domain-containing protein [Szabonella alba]